jgi:hypothetical protein
MNQKLETLSEMTQSTKELASSLLVLNQLLDVLLPENGTLFSTWFPQPPDEKADL